MSDESVSLEYVALSAIERWPRNPKLHDKDRLDTSIDRFGFIQPLVVDETTGRLVAGHGRLESLSGMKAAGKEPPRRIRLGDGGEWLVPVIRGVGFANEHDAEAFLLADNRLVELGGWDDEQLSKMLDDLVTAAIPIDLLGFAGNDSFVAPTDPLESGQVIDEGTVSARLKLVKCPHCGGDVPI